MNLIGEHTDYNGGPCLPFALEQGTTVRARRRPDREVHLTSTRYDDPSTGSLDAAGRPGHWSSYVVGVLRALLEDGLEVPGLDLEVDSDVPVGAGLSSSAALEGAVAVAVANLLELPLDGETRRRLAAACIRAETEYVGAPTGGMDQTVAFLAEPGHALLVDFGDASTTTVPLSLPEAGLALVVTDTGVAHSHAGGEYAARRADCEAAARLVGRATLGGATATEVEAIADDRVRRRARHVVAECQRVRDAVEALKGQDWGALGGLLTASHVSLRDDFEVSCPELDLAVTTAIEAGALGARMTGGGFGGAAIALVPEARTQALTSAVDRAFVAAGLAAPTHLRAVPSGPAG